MSPKVTDSDPLLVQSSTCFKNLLTLIVSCIEIFSNNDSTSYDTSKAFDTSKSFYTVKIVFHSSSMNDDEFINYFVVKFSINLTISIPLENFAKRRKRFFFSFSGDIKTMA